ncbi:hypothetical protein [Salinimicrobium oceani]|uniref:Uncharacterized protein n=1 Tax=Salinimicrobium oceani TaxID=2722702 RepID=A0ABX1D1C7_9FLAO|nr:hypothetical protein [Salinimicrobium oceani]NJW52478.1 hypothetical protein [Salinimicrobium oceani]
MHLRERLFGRKEILNSYTYQINWDWLFSKVVFIFAAILSMGIAAFVVWVLQ